MRDYCYAEGAGTTSADFLKIPVGARETALGGAFSPISDNSNAVYYNPAGLGLIKFSEISFTYNKYLEGINQQWLSFAYPGALGTLGLGFNYLAVSPFDSYDNEDNRTGSVSAADMAVFLSYGGAISFDSNLIKSFSCGFSAKYIVQRLDDKNGNGNAFDFGVLAVSGIENLKLSFGIDNFASDKIKFIDEEVSLAKTYKAGVSYKLSSADSRLGVLIAVQNNFPEDGDDYISAGIENVFYETLALRIGYNSFGNISNKVNFGAGFDLPGGLLLDYSYGVSRYFGNIQKVTLAYKFGRSLERERLPSSTVVISTKNQSAAISTPDQVARNLKIVTELGKNRSEHSINLLLGFLDSKNSAISKTAFFALSGFEDAGIIIKILSVKNEDIRIMAITALMRHKGDKVLKAFKISLYDKSSKVRKKAA
ncbi:MAG: PorV/PorQ family protein, partial [Elusimicrobiota bacterium]|nr:PorV/PorQ family protein [Elusimicrobiota bacterium]